MAVPLGDLSTPGDMAHGVAGGDLAVAGDDMAAPNPGPAPLVVDDHYATSGYFAQNDPAASIKEDNACPMRAGQGRGKCHHLTWTPNGNGWGGVFWQSPVNNWGDKPGYAIEAGYTQVRFYAWGAAGGEKLSFMAGVNTDKDGFQSELDVVLTAAPKEYVIGVRNAYAAAVVSAFAWSLSDPATVATAQSFYIDDVVWSSADDASTSFAVASKFAPSLYFGDGSLGFVREAAGDCTPPAGGDAACHHFVWDPELDGGAVSQHYAGIWWQSTDNAKPAVAIPAGLREVRFWAWGGKGGELVSFLAGYGSGDADGFQGKLTVKLRAQPTLYSIGVGGAYGAGVVGGLGWVANDAVNTNGLSLYVDGATWR